LEGNNSRRNPFGSKSVLENDMDRAIADLLGKNVARKATRIIKTVDEQTTEEYEVKMDSATGEPRIIKTIKSTKKDCSICGRKVVQIFNCSAPGCGALVCGEHKRTTSYFSSNYRFQTVCSSCFESAIQLQNTHEEVMDRLHRRGQETNEQMHRHTMDRERIRY